MYFFFTFNFLDMRFKNSPNSMVPFPSESTSFIMSYSSSLLGFCPNDFITAANSSNVIHPAHNQNKIKHE